MNNKYVFAVVAGILLFAWYWVGHQPYYADGDSLSQGYIITAILVLALGGGKSDGADLISAITGAITGFIPKFIGLGIAYLVSRVIYEGVISEAGFQAMGLVHSIAVLVASGVLIIATMACLKKA